jgi:hypothetical protein
MKIVAIDAGRGRSTVSQTLAAAVEAARDVGAQVISVRLSDFRIRDCVGCKLCALGDGCKINDGLQDLSLLIAEADGVILTAPGSYRGGDRAFKALTTRLRTYFENDNQPYLPGLGPDVVRPSKVARATKRAIIIAGAGGSGPISAFFSRSNGQIRTLRQSLANCHIGTVGTMAVVEKPAGAELAYPEWDRAHSLGRLLAGKL